MDAGMTIDELAHSVSLPPELAEKPHLREYYGRVEYAVRAYVVGTMGWFDGNPTSLSPLSPQDEAQRMIRRRQDRAGLAGNRKFARKRQYQWALQLLDRLIHAGEDVDRASAAKAAVLRDRRRPDQLSDTALCIQCARELEQAAGETGA